MNTCKLYAADDKQRQGAMSNILYETDFYAWTQRQAALLRGEAFEQIDWNNLIEEIESLGRSEKHEVESRLEVLIMHLLKWQYQPYKRLTGRSWRATIAEQRRRLRRRLREMPSLRAQLPDLLQDIYPDAVDAAAIETSLEKRTFPPHCPWTVEQLLDEEFWP